MGIKEEDIDSDYDSEEQDKLNSEEEKKLLKDMRDMKDMKDMEKDGKEMKEVVKSENSSDY